MKKAVTVVLAAILAIVMTGCGKEIDFEALGVSEQYYQSALTIMEQYYSDEFAQRVADIYADYGQGTFDEKEAEKETGEIRKEIAESYFDLYAQSEDNEKEQKLVLFTYNFSLLNLLECEVRATEKEEQADSGYEQELKKYHQAFLESPSADLFEEFRLYIEENDVMEFKKTVSIITVEDVAKLLENDYVTTILKFKQLNSDINNGDLQIAYDTYLEFMTSFKAMKVTLEKYPEFKEEFLKEDLSEITTMVENSVSNFRGLLRSVEENDYEYIQYYLKDVGKDLEMMGDYLTELLANIQKYSTDEN